jgi:hypothetical protein
MSADFAYHGCGLDVARRRETKEEERVVTSAPSPRTWELVIFKMHVGDASFLNKALLSIDF